MKIGIMQAYFFPYIGYFQVIDAVDRFLVYENVSFRKRTWITRNRLLRKSTGEIYLINVPVSGGSSNKTISEITINNNSDWRNKLLQTIHHDYKDSNFFELIYPIIAECVNFKNESLHCYNSRVIVRLCQLLKIQTKIEYCHQRFIPLENNLKSQKEILYKNSRTHRIIEICLSEGATEYINPIGGTELYNKNHFIKKGIKLNFVSPNTPTPYNQFNNTFAPHLSIIDLLMHTGIENTMAEVKNYTIV